MKNSIQIGIDQSFTKTGFVMNVNNGEIIESTVFTGFKSDEAYSIFIRAKTMADEVMGKILSICNEYPLHEVKIVLEGLSFAALGSSSRDLAGLQYLIVTKLLDDFEPHEIDIVAPTSLKKFATGSGNASKDDMVDAVEAKDAIFHQILLKTPKSKGRHDLADAYWLSCYVR